MNPVVVVHFLSALLAMGVAVPLIKRRIKMNEAYGVRFAQAFASDEAWFELNHYGGKLLFRWGVVIALTALVGVPLKKEMWVAYNWSALVIIAGGLIFIIARTYRYARTLAVPPRSP